jgi:Lar family restriction alleviation protein
MQLNQTPPVDNSCSAEGQHKPCPFCGSEAYPVRKNPYFNILKPDYYLECEKCELKLGLEYDKNDDDYIASFNTAEEALEFWNTRSISIYKKE